MEIERLVRAQREFFRSGATLPVPERIQRLRQLQAAIRQSESAISQALYDDLGKGGQEAYMTEIGMVLSELEYILRRLPRWARASRVPSPVSAFPARSYILPEPYGSALIMSPWNYPFLLTLEPAIGALAAGNTVVLKPSAYSPATSAVIDDLLAQVFPPELAAVVPGGREENAALLRQQFDYIFFTGSTAVGKVVMEAAAAHLTPISLELGGKSPCILDQTADIPLAARRIAFGKCLNAGQTCVAPDYVYLHTSQRESFIREYAKNIREFFGDAPLASPELPRIVNQKHYARLMGLLSGADIALGGEGDGSKISPTLIDHATWDSPAMGEEIFGPILPLLTYEHLEDALAQIQQRPKPLALYLFSQDKSIQRQVLRRLSFGGGCVNDTIFHLTSSHLPFGGVGASGMGQYHGKYSFDTFSHPKSIMKRGAMDLSVRYHPYSEKKARLIRRIMK